MNYFNFNITLTYIVGAINVEDNTVYPASIEGTAYSDITGNSLPVIYFAVLSKDPNNAYNIEGKMPAGNNPVQFSGTNEAISLKFIAFPIYSDLSSESHIFDSEDGCYYNEEFYYNSSGLAIDSNGVSFDPTKWTLLSSADDYLTYGLVQKDNVISTKDAIEDVFIVLERVDDNDLKYKVSVKDSFNGSFDHLTIDGVSYSTNDQEYIFNEGLVSIVGYVENDYGDIIDKTQNFLIVSTLKAIANFSVSGNTVTFTNTSIGNPTIFSWDFGSGGNTSTSQNTSFTYPTLNTSENYTVTFTVSKVVNGVQYVDQISFSVTIQASSSCKDLYLEEYYTDACHSFISFEKDNIGVERKLYLKTYGGTLISSYIIDSDKTGVKYNVDKDGVYIAQIYTLDSDGEDDQLVKEFPVYTFCNVEQCYEKLSQKVLCCDDLCKEECLDEESKKIRFTLSLFTALLSMVNRYVYLERNKYLGLTVIDDTRMEYIERVVKYSDLLVLAYSRCNNCFNDEDLDSDCCN